jgi:hypothetical protein
MVMTRRRFALLSGILFLLLGLAGFVPPLVGEMHPEHPPLTLDANAGQLFGLFPVNLLHNLLHIIFGLSGIVASRRLSSAKFYSRNIAIIYLMLTIAGFLPGLQNGFGLVPLYGNDIWLHPLFALLAAYYGWLHRDTVVSAPAPEIGLDS